MLHTSVYVQGVAFHLLGSMLPLSLQGEHKSLHRNQQYHEESKRGGRVCTEKFCKGILPIKKYILKVKGNPQSRVPPPFVHECYSRIYVGFITH